MEATESLMELDAAPLMPVNDVAVRGVSRQELRRVIIASVMGSVVEWFDFSVYGYLAAVMGAVFFPTGTPTMQLVASLGAFAIAFMARPFGGMLFGPLGDRYGRKKVLTATIVMMALATFLIGLVPSYREIGIVAPILLVLLRLVQGLSAGGEASGAAIFVAEYCGDKRRTFATGWVEVGCMGGFLFGAALIALLNQCLTAGQMASWGWRLPFLLALPMGAIGLYIRSHLEETPVFNAAVREERSKRASSGWKLLFGAYKGKMLQSCGFIIVTNVTLFTVVTYLPTFLVSTLKLDRTDGLTISLIPIVGLVVTIPFLALLADRIGRKKVMLMGAVGVIVLAVPCFELLAHGSTFERVAALLVLNLCLSCFISCIYAAVPSLFPVTVRFSGMALTYNVSVALFAGTAPMINQWLIHATGNTMIPAYYLIAGALVGVVALLCSEDMTGKPMLGDAPYEG